MVLALAAGVLGLAVVGTLLALYFALVERRVIAPDASWLPAVCRMDEDTCAAVVDTRWGHLFGVPNWVLGLAWYVVAGVAGAWGVVTGAVPWCGPLVLLAAGSVLVSVVLAWSLLRRLETRCTLCFTSHAINVAIWGALAWACTGA